MSIWLVITLAVATFGLTLWFEAFLLGRDLSNLRLRLAGTSLIIYALSRGCLILHADTGQGGDFFQTLFVLPAVLWIGKVVTLLLEHNRCRAL